ncbi:hypothetical protein HD806DRAFT_477294 [Xylariaceae sp. AK1471]|nr:hypothetical protein HD806DRAFT_477294 [Xylariaceae sp. AK1471]
MAADSGIEQLEVASNTTILAITSFLAVAFYNVAELTFITFASFKRWSGLYFWSFLISSWGIAFYGVGFLIRDLELSKNSIMYVTLIVIGWWAMVTGQSVVLYSRLHLVLHNRSRLRLVLGMIIFNAIICHIPITVLVYGSNSSNPAPFVEPYSIYEKVQVTIFFIQESIISALYIASTASLMKLKSLLHGDTNRQIMKHLIYVNVMIVLLDITILGLEYSGLYIIQTAYKALVYSIKLKFEFSILNKLVDLTQTRQGNSSSRCEVTDPIPLDTFNDDQKHKNLTSTKRTKDNTSVFMHTEVVVHREMAADRKEKDRDNIRVGSAISREDDIWESRGVSSSGPTPTSWMLSVHDIGSTFGVILYSFIDPKSVKARILGVVVAKSSFDREGRWQPCIPQEVLVASI